MDSSSSDLVGEFQCVGDIDSSDALCSGDNDDEQPASAAATALEPPWNAPGGANWGFLREEALLIVIAITDEDEQPRPAVPAQSIFDRIVAVKGGVSRVVFLGIGGASDCSGPYGEANEARTLMAVTEGFIAEGHGVFWDLCQGQLEDGLTSAMTTIELACSEMVY
jgi:hypothetical protein